MCLNRKPSPSLRVPGLHPGWWNMMKFTHKSTIVLMEEILHQWIGSLAHSWPGFIHPRISSISSIVWSTSFWWIFSSLVECEGFWHLKHEAFLEVNQVTKSHSGLCMLLMISTETQTGMAGWSGYEDFHKFNQDSWSFWDYVIYVGCLSTLRIWKLKIPSGRGSS